MVVTNAYYKKMLTVHKQTESKIKRVCTGHRLFSNCVVPFRKNAVRKHQTKNVQSFFFIIIYEKK